MINLYQILYHVIKMYPYFHYILYMYFLCKSFFMKNVAETNKWNEKKKISEHAGLLTVADPGGGATGARPL